MKKQPGKISPARIDLKQLPVLPEARKLDKRTTLARVSRKYFETLLTEIKNQLPKYAEETPVPDTIEPMMAVKSDLPFDDKDWLFEFHQTGQRAIAIVDGDVKLLGENAVNLNDRFPAVADALQQWPLRIVLDGTIVNIREEIDADVADGEEQFVYYVSDAIWLDGIDLSNLPLHQRKSILMHLMPDSATLRISDHIEEFGKSFYKLANSNNQQGIVARKKDAVYEKGKLSSNWMVIKRSLIDTPITEEAIAEDPEQIPECKFRKGASIQILNFDGRNLLLTKLHSHYSQELHLRKEDVVEYYCGLAEYIFPYMNERPLEVRGSDKLWRSIEDQKWIKTFCRNEAGVNRTQRYVIPGNIASLIYLVNAGLVEQIGWHSRAGAPQYPDWAIISVDGERKSGPFLQTLNVLHQLLKNFDVPSYPKISLEGIDVYVPLAAKYNFEQAKQFAAIICKMVMDETGSLQSHSRRSKTPGTLIHFEKNHPTFNAHLPYSILKPGSIHTSTPLYWDEAISGSKAADFTIQNTVERVKSEGDIFGEVLGKGVDLNHLLKGLATLVSVRL